MFKPPTMTGQHKRQRDGKDDGLLLERRDKMRRCEAVPDIDDEDDESNSLEEDKAEDERTTAKRQMAPEVDERQSLPKNEPASSRGNQDPSSDLIALKSPSLATTLEADVATTIDTFLSARLQAVYYRQAYRMTPNHFWKLYHLLSPHLPSSSPGGDGVALTLSSALRYFAGGDSAADHNLPDFAAVERHVWQVVDAIHACEQLKVDFPASHTEQLEIAAGFEMIKSDVGIAACAGSLGSMLVWTEKPGDPARPVEDSSSDFASSHFNLQHNKYGLQLQAVSDHDGRFLHVSLDHPGSTSDFVAFNKSELCRQLQTEGFLVPGLALFAKESYAPCPCVVTPFTGGTIPKVEQESNKHHQQLSESVDAALVALLRRWSVLRRPLPRRFGLAKQRALVLALAKLHNFCLEDNEPMLPGLAKDLVYGFDHGAFFLRDSDGAKCELIGCGSSAGELKQAIDSATAGSKATRSRVQGILQGLLQLV